MLLNKELLSNALADGCIKKPGNSLRAAKNIDEVDLEEHDVSFSIDSRSILPGEIFLPLKGNHVDGHTFIRQALEKGAIGALVSNKDALANVPCELLKNALIILVPDTLQALWDLAIAWRNALDIPFVGITGSIGKTSTKEILKTILIEAGKKAYVSYKNQNTTIGLPLNLLKVTQDHEVAVFEMGISERGEMEKLADVLRPSLALITCIAHAHSQGLGTMHDVSYEKRKIFKHYAPCDVGIIFGDQSVLTQAFYQHPVAKFGYKTKNQVQARKVRVVEDDQGRPRAHFILKWYGKKASITLKNNHRGLVSNSLGASSLAYFLEIPFPAVVRGLENYEGFENRFEIKHLLNNRGRLISDCYNANPESMKAALIAFDEMKVQGKKIAVLGDMLELGEKEVYWHRQIGRILRRLESIQAVILVGKRAWKIAETLPTRIDLVQATDWKEAGALLEDDLTKQKDDASLVLVKGSLGMQLGKMVKNFVEQ